MESIPSSQQSIQNLFKIDVDQLTKQESVLGRLFKEHVLGPADMDAASLISESTNSLENEISLIQDRLTIHGTGSPDKASKDFEQLIYIIDSIDKVACNLQGTSIGYENANKLSMIESKAKDVLAHALSKINEEVEEIRDSDYLQDLEDALASHQVVNNEIMEKFEILSSQFENIALISEKFEGLDFEITYQNDLEEIKSILTEFRNYIGS